MQGYIRIINGKDHGNYCLGFRVESRYMDARSTNHIKIGPDPDW